MRRIYICENNCRISIHIFPPSQYNMRHDEWYTGLYFWNIVYTKRACLGTIQWFIETVKFSLWHWQLWKVNLSAGERQGRWGPDFSELVDWLRTLLLVTLSTTITHTWSDTGAGGTDQLTLIKTILIVFSIALSCWWHTIQFVWCVRGYPLMITSNSFLFIPIMDLLPDENL